MNDAMYEDPATQANLRRLRARGYEIVEPERGFLAERETGVGRLAARGAIVAALERALARTAIAARQARRDHRRADARSRSIRCAFSSNASTGTTGIELAREAARAAPHVTLLLGPTLLEPPPGVRRRARDDRARDATPRRSRTRPAPTSRSQPPPSPTGARRDRADSKVKKTGDELERRARAESRRSGGARRTQERDVSGRLRGRDRRPRSATRARSCARKHLDAIAVNDVSGERGFGTGENALVLLWGEDGRSELGRRRKAALAARLLDAVEDLMKCS